MGFFSVERGADGMTVMYWYHRQFIQAAMDRYCENAKILHEALADFFSGKWSNGIHVQCNLFVRFTSIPSLLKVIWSEYKSNVS